MSHSSSFRWAKVDPPPPADGEVPGFGIGIFDLIRAEVVPIDVRMVLRVGLELGNPVFEGVDFLNRAVKREAE